MYGILLTAIVLAINAVRLEAQTVSFHDYTAVTIQHDTISLQQFAGKKLMIVNTASFCGYTPQFEGLEQLYLDYNPYNFEIIGFPCNDFSNQDPHSDSTILDFCQDNYGVTFPMMAKVQIVTGDTAPVYKWLQRADLNGVQNAHVAWNFNKFLVDEAGNWVRHFTSTTLPDDTAITNWIMEGQPLGTPRAEENSVALRAAFSNNVLTISGRFDTEQLLKTAVYHTSGSLCWENNFRAPAGASEFQINAAGFPAGLYLLAVQSREGRLVHRFAIAR